MNKKRKKYTQITNFFQSTNQVTQVFSTESREQLLEPSQPIEPTEKESSETQAHRDDHHDDMMIQSASTFDINAAQSSDLEPKEFLNLGIIDEPNHPDNCSSIPFKQTKSQRIYFQKEWFKEYPWLHYRPDICAVVCFKCAKAEHLGILSLSKKNEPAFISDGFSNWKKAKQRFNSHQLSECHKCSESQLKELNKPTISNKISIQIGKQQESARKSLLYVFHSLRFLLRQGLPFRRKEPGEGNFDQLLKLFSITDSQLQSYLQKTTNFTSSNAQSEIIKMIGQSVVKKVIDEIRRDGIFAVMVDGTQDISGLEQEAVCFRHVDSKNFEVHESFVGLYNIPDTSGETISKMILDTLTRFNLNINDLRGQTYDGAANMKGKHNGCQANIKSKQPLALHFHCASHLANLVLEHSVSESPIIRDSIQLVNELGVLFKRSTKFKEIYQQTLLSNMECYQEDNVQITRRNIRPLCPTRWLCRLPAISSVLENYEVILESLQIIANTSKQPEMAAKGNGLLARFQSGEIYLVLKMSTGPIAVLEQLNSAFQARRANISGMIEATNICLQQLKYWRTEEHFSELFTQATDKVKALDLDPLRVPKKRKFTEKRGGSNNQFNHQTAEEFYRQNYFMFIDRIVVEMTERFNVSSNTDLKTYVELEKILISGEVDEDQQQIVSRYPELNFETLSTQLKMFKQAAGVSTLHEAKDYFKNMHIEVRALFPQVEKILKLLLVCPVTSSSCERSFSALRRLKNWMRSSMGQERLNNVAVCHTHNTILEDLDLSVLLNEFVMRSETRRNMFGCGI